MRKRHLNPVITDWVNLFVFGFGLGLGFTTSLLTLFFIVTVILN